MAEIEDAEKPACACERCVTLHKVPRSELIELLDQQVHAEAVDTLTTRDYYRDASVALAAKLEGKRELLREIEDEAKAFREVQAPCCYNAAFAVVSRKYASPTEESR